VGLINMMTGAGAVRSRASSVAAECNARHPEEEMTVVITQGQIGMAKMPDAVRYIVTVLQSRGHQVLNIQMPDYSTAYLMVRTARRVSDAERRWARPALPLDENAFPRIEGVYVAAICMQDVDLQMECLRFDLDGTLHYGKIERRGRDELMEFGMPSLDPFRGTFETDESNRLSGLADVNGRTLTVWGTRLSERRMKAVLGFADGDSVTEGEWVFLVDGNAGEAPPVPEFSQPASAQYQVPSAAPAPDHIGEELSKLAALFERGLLTEAEFVAAKAKLLA
jgi:hypothetical protein